MKIVDISPQSIAEELGIKVGDELVKFGDYPITDILDYEYYNSLENFAMTVISEGIETEYDIEKSDDEDLGMSFDSELSVYPCRNKCKFCFIDQLPKDGLRTTLKIKDDDYRHSFISGNYITLTNLCEADFQRILRLKLSPLYISVHATDDNLRRSLIGNPTAQPIMPILQRLKDAGIRLHTQIVYCPTFNDDLSAYIDDLSGVAESLAIVPVGLTKYSNPDLVPVDAETALNVIYLIMNKQEELLTRIGTRFVYASDEFYIKADYPVPASASYEDFPQIENGVGLIAEFLRDFAYASTSYGGKGKRCSIATGESAYNLIRSQADFIAEKFGGQINVFKVLNQYFGESITVAGLVVGKDIYNALLGKDLGEELILPRCMLKEFGDVFLDNMTVGELSRLLNIKITICDTDGESFVKALLKTPISLQEKL